MAMLDQVPTLPARFGVEGKRCTVVDTVPTQYRTPPLSPIRARGQKCMLSDDAREKSVSGACVPTAGMKVRGRANTLITLYRAPLSTVQSKFLLNPSS